MANPLEGATFLCMWIGFLLLMIGSIAGIFVWAIRTRQFSDQDRARYLALQSGIPERSEKNEDEKDGRPWR